MALETGCNAGPETVVDVRLSGSIWRLNGGLEMKPSTAPPSRS
uniref:Uncharacterized protein n=1 Tax=Brassica oleracea TaxID=3712 RepID=A0A3P6AYD8_BRAOL|nr:unnamed protein product [Brassica oleracea]